jgi:hypothetical protein
LAHFAILRVLFFSFPLLFPPLTAIITVFLTGLRYDEEHVLHFFPSHFQKIKNKNCFYYFCLGYLRSSGFAPPLFPSVAPV